MKLIKLGGKHGSIIGNYCQVDDEDYEELNKYKWYGHNAGYAIRYTYIEGIRKGNLMHRSLLGITDKVTQVDHIDGNGLNNQRENLRPATHSQNQANRQKAKNTTSIYLGVYRINRQYRNCEARIYWKGTCQKNGKAYEKCHKTEREAALWYNEKAKELHGEYARLNIIE